MKKLFFGIFLLATSTLVSQAQPVPSTDKSVIQDAEQQNVKPDEFMVNGFARDRDAVKVRAINPSERQIDGFSVDDMAARKEERREARMDKKFKEVTHRKIKADRNKDIETLMLDLDLARVQRPVFRGIMTEHQRDVNDLVANATIDNSEKNVRLKQLYALRNKRLMETLSDAQYKKWKFIKDQDMYLNVDRPEDF